MSVNTNFANPIRDGMSTKTEFQERKAIKKLCTMGKVACVAAAIVVATVAAFVILSGSFAGVLIGVATGAIGLTLLHDYYCFFDNIQKIYDNALSEKLKFKDLDEKKMRTELTRGMIVVRPLMESWFDFQTKQR